MSSPLVRSVPRLVLLGCFFALTTSLSFAQEFYVGFTNGKILVVGADNPVGVGHSKQFGTATHPEGMAADANGNLYVSDSSDNVIYKFTSNGVRSTFVSGLNAVSDIALDSLGNIYAADTNNNRIVAYTPTGQSLGVYGTGATDAEALTFDQNDVLFVASQSGNSILKYATGGGAPTVFATTTSPVTLTFDSNFNQLYVGSGGSGVTVFNRSGVGTPYSPATGSTADMTFDLDGNFYVLDGNIERFAPDGTKTTFATLNGGGSPNGFVFVPPTGRQVAGIGTIATASGTGRFQFNVVEQTNGRITGQFSYKDSAAGINLTTNSFSNFNIIGEEAGLRGTAKIHNAPVTFNVTALDLDGTNATDQFSIRLSTGYSASGNLTSGRVYVVNGDE